ncbi:MAG: hypothetical protein MZU97_06835 [Bacillus subtilis]|nr:hypothetical protein [Bacillus subtilis]
MFTHPGQEAALHGRRVRADARVEGQGGARLVLASQYPLARTRRTASAATCSRFYGARKALYELDRDPGRLPPGSTPTNRDQSIYSFIALCGTDPDESRRRRPQHDAASPTTPTASAFRRKGVYEEILNSDKDVYGGSNVYNGLPLASDPEPMHACEHSIDDEDSRRFPARSVKFRTLNPLRDIERRLQAKRS